MANPGLPSEAELTRLYTDLVDFYNKYKPQNITEDTLTILMQFFIDAGGEALNSKLRKKYGHDLNTFRVANLQLVNNRSQDNDRASQAMSRLSLRNSLESDLGITLAPSKKMETSVNARNLRTSLEAIRSHPHNGNSKAKKRKKKRINKDPELAIYKKQMEEKRNALTDDIDDILFNNEKDEEALKKERDEKLGFYLLDDPNAADPSMEEVLQAFYSKYDHDKVLDGKLGNILLWIEQHDFDSFNRKIKDKYNDDLVDYIVPAQRRTKLDLMFRNFMNKHDPDKLREEKIVLQLVQWTMENGVFALNEKLKSRYGRELIATGPIEIDVDAEI